MPYVGGGNDLVQQALALTQLMQARRERQGERQLELAKPGDTFESLGIDDRTFRALYGKSTKYDPKRVVSELTPQALVDRNLVGFIQTLGPIELSNMAATMMNYREGTPGATTREGRLAAQETGAREAKLKNEVSAETFESDKATAIAKSHTGRIEADRAKITAQDVMDRTLEGINSWRAAPKETQRSLNEKLVYGTSREGVEQEKYKAQLATNAVRQALLAETDPKHPLHGFLNKVGLNLNTVLAGTAMGIETMFSDYARYNQQMTVAGKEGSNIMLRMYTDTAKQMAEQVFKGKLSPGQVLTIIKSREDGTPLPKGMEAAAAVYDRAVDANFSAALQDALEKGDPFLSGLNQSIQSLGKLTDPGSLSFAASMRRQAAAYAATVQQMGKPTDAASAKRFDTLMQKNLQRAMSVKYDAPWFGANSWQPEGMPDPTQMPQGLPQNVQDIMKPRRGTPPITGQMPAGLNLTPVQGAPKGPVAGMAGLSTEDQQAIADFLASLGAGSTAGAGRPPQ